MSKHVFMLVLCNVPLEKVTAFQTPNKGLEVEQKRKKKRNGRGRRLVELTNGC